MPYGHQNITDDDVAAVVETLRSGWLTQGPKVTSFEHALAEYGGARHAIAASNGTAALHAACVALGVGSTDIVWTSPISFVASANCARYCGAQIDFVDIDPATRLMSVEKLKQKLIDAEKQNALPKVVIPVHYAGLACDMAAIAELAKQYRFYVIEDAAHAIGSRYRTSSIGDCTYSDFAIYSFHPVKTMTTAEGGAVLTNQDDLAQTVRQFITHGITRDVDKLTVSSDSSRTKTAAPWYYEQQLLGFNYRLSDLHAALGISQLKRLDGFVEKRRNLFLRYHELLKDLPLILPKERADTQSAWHLFAIEINREFLAEKNQSGNELYSGDFRRYVFDFLRSHNVGVNVHYIPIHLQPDYRALGFSEGDFPSSENYYHATITLPLFPDLTDAQQEYIATKLREVLV